MELIFKKVPLMLALTAEMPGPCAYCLYHGWTYSNDGRLLAITDRRNFEGFYGGILEHFEAVDRPLDIPGFPRHRGRN